MGAEALDEDELEGELDALQQEELTNKMLDTGTVPVNDKVTRLPTGPVGDGEYSQLGLSVLCTFIELTSVNSQRKGASTGRGRGRGTTEASGRNGNVDRLLYFDLIWQPLNSSCHLFSGNYR